MIQSTDAAIRQAELLVEDVAADDPMLGQALADTIYPLLREFHRLAGSEESVVQVAQHAVC